MKRLQLNLSVIDNESNKVDALCLNGISPEFLTYVLPFLRPDWTASVTCVEVDVNAQKLNS